MTCLLVRWHVKLKNWHALALWHTKLKNWQSFLTLACFLAHWHVKMRSWHALVVLAHRPHQHLWHIGKWFTKPLKHSSRFSYVPGNTIDMYSLVLKFSYSLRIKILQNADWQNQMWYETKIFDPDATSCGRFLQEKLGNKSLALK